MSAVALQIHDIICSYGSRPVLDGITFRINKGDFVGIIGPNGSGKTTLLKTISRVLTPRSGKIVLLNKDINFMTRPEIARRLAVVAQDNRIDFDFTVEEVVLMGRLPHLRRFEKESQKDLAKAHKAMELTRTSHLASRLITELSGGEKQRVMIARALTQQPEVLLLDEPTSHLDINHQTEILDLMKKLSRENKLTIAAVLHDLNTAAHYCDYLILLSEGKVFALGSPQEVITADNIKAVYNSDVLVTNHPVYKRPMVTPLSRLEESPEREMLNFSVHVVGGGGAASPLLQKLVTSGYRVTAGVLNISDSDWQKAKALGIPVVEAPPFSAITEKGYKNNLELMQKADAVILASIPFGFGNLKNLEAVLAAAQNGRFTIVLEEDDITRRDYTDGEASKIYYNLIKNEVYIVHSIKEVLDVLAQEVKKCKGGN
ncbi:MAG: cobalamin transport system ATP-binding protein [Thermosediminibacterales bacterium]|nr:cobalamin transport system ATP-binding protein [Thermosediminibacterales bacterium]